MCRNSLVNRPHDFFCPADGVKDGSNGSGHTLPAARLSEFPSSEDQQPNLAALIHSSILQVRLVFAIAKC